MNIGNLFKIAVKALGNNKFRGFLTMLGIIIGVAAVITMLAIGQGSKRSIQAQISEMGSNMIMIHPGGERMGGVRLSSEDMESLKLEDLQEIQTQTSFVTYVSPAVNSSGQAIYGARNTPTTVYGVNQDYLEIRRYRVQDGEMFSEQDIRTAAKVCLVGKSVTDELFPDGQNPIGKVIRFGTIPQEGEELLRIVPLKRMAKHAGIEKVVLKKGQMSLHLVTNPDSPYYQSEAFDKLIAFIQRHPRECNLRDQNGKRSIVIKGVPTVEAACRYMQELE